MWAKILAFAGLILSLFGIRKWYPLNGPAPCESLALRTAWVSALLGYVIFVVVPHVLYREWYGFYGAQSDQVPIFTPNFVVQALPRHLDDQQEAASQRVLRIMRRAHRGVLLVCALCFFSSLFIAFPLLSSLISEHTCVAILKAASR